MTAAPFPPTSRYAAVEVATYTEPGGREIAYLRRRFCPDPDQLTQLSSYTVVQNDRLDRIAAATLGDPLQFWQIADANRALDPDELTAPIGRRLRITAPAGFGGLSGA
jgi:hypothetical protein